MIFSGAPAPEIVSFALRARRSFARALEVNFSFTVAAWPALTTVLPRATTVLPARATSVSLPAWAFVTRRVSRCAAPWPAAGARRASP